MLSMESWKTHSVRQKPKPHERLWRHRTHELERALAFFLVRIKIGEAGRCAGRRTSPDLRRRQAGPAFDGRAALLEAARSPHGDDSFSGRIHPDALTLALAYSRGIFGEP